MMMRNRTVITLPALLILGSVACGTHPGASNPGAVPQGAAAGAGGGGPSPGPAKAIWSFDDAKVGRLPEGWSNVAGAWQVVAEPTAPSKHNVLAQVSKEHTGGFFNLAVLDEATFVDLAVTVQVRGVAGQEDQGGGPVWRYQDARNYYVARHNNLEGNYRVYKVIDGRRIQLGSADVKADSRAGTPGTWHTLKVTMTGARLECFFDGKKYLDVKDETFKRAGKVGLWTKADAQTQFDDFVAAAAGEVPSALKPGEAIAEFQFVCQTGPLRGKVLPITTVLGEAPVVAAFINSRPGHAARLLASMQELGDSLKERGLRAFVVFMADPDVSDEIRTYAIQEKITMPVGHPAMGLRTPGIAAYRIHPAARNTILVYRNRKVEANFVNVDAEMFVAVIDAAEQATREPAPLTRGADVRLRAADARR